MIGRILDELVYLLRKLKLSSHERVALTALILLDGGLKNFFILKIKKIIFLLI